MCSLQWLGSQHLTGSQIQRHDGELITVKLYIEVSNDYEVILTMLGTLMFFSMRRAPEVHDS